MSQPSETANRLSKSDYEAQLPSLRLGLLNAQFELRNADFPVVILVGGDDRIGCEGVADILHEWLDARHVHTRFFGPASEEERERPPFWRFWRELPRDGRIGLFMGAWTMMAIAARLDGRVGRKVFEQWLDYIRRFERALVDDGTLLLKFWVHLPKKELKQRLRRARRKPKAEWRVDRTDFDVYEKYEEAMSLAKQVAKATGVSEAPWIVVESQDERSRNLTVARAIHDAVVNRLQAGPMPARARENEGRIEIADALGAVDLSVSMEKSEYRKELDRLQPRLHRLSRKARAKGVTSVLVFEGWDAAGKGGTIRRMTQAMSARDYSVVPIAAPTEEERSRHYLWRFWRHLPRRGRMLIFDRSWYGRVLVERIEGFASEEEWRRAYGEIRDFERQLVAHGIVLQKYWLHLDPDEQIRRFEDRKQTPYKKYKLTDEDYRNREKWDQYTAAVNEMVARTDRPGARWHVIPSNDKFTARIEVLKRVTRALKKAL